MGYELRRALREALGPDITGLQRAVALEIADDASDATRRSMVPLEDLARWTGAASPAVVRNALKRLAAAGWEFRVPIGQGKDGRALYAVPGTRMTFKVPAFEGGAPATSSADKEDDQGAPAPPKEEPSLPHGVAPAPPQPPQGVAPAHSEGAPAPSEGAPATPFPSDPSDPSEELASWQGGAGATPAPPEPIDYGIPEQARPLVDQITAAIGPIRWPFRGDGWFPVLALIQKAGIPAMVDHARRAAARSDVESARYFMRGWAELPPQPPPGAERPRLRAINGDRHQQQTDDMFDRAMARAKARMQQEQQTS